MGEKRSLLILGTRTLAVEIADLVSEIPGFQVAGFVENMEPLKCKEKLEGLPIIWVEEIQNFTADHLAVCGLATTHRSRFTDQVSRMGLSFATLIHPAARISSRSTVGEGCIISPGVVIASHTQLGTHVFINRGVLIGHHTRIDDFVTLQPGANIAGSCTIGRAVFIGMGAIIMDHIAIGSGSVIGAGSVVTKDVPEGVQVIGIPAKVVKKNISGR